MRNLFPPEAESPVHGPARVASPVHLHRDGPADRAGHAVGAAHAWPPTSSRRSTSRWSASSGTTTACRPRRWASASRPPVERGLTTTVSDIEHIESHLAARHRDHQGLLPAHGQHPDGHRADRGRHADPGAAAAAGHHAAAGHQVLGLQHPGGAAGAVQQHLAPSSRVFDAAVNILRPRLVTIPGVAIPGPYGGKVKVISVDLDIPGAAGPRPGAGRRGERGQHPEPDPAVGHRQARRYRVHGAA
jgi:hypothetical protein